MIQCVKIQSIVLKNVPFYFLCAVIVTGRLLGIIRYVSVRGEVTPDSLISLLGGGWFKRQPQNAMQRTYGALCFNLIGKFGGSIWQNANNYVHTYAAMCTTQDLPTYKPKLTVKYAGNVTFVLKLHLQSQRTPLINKLFKYRMFP